MKRVAPLPNLHSWDSLSNNCVEFMARKRYTTESFIEKAKIIHSDTYDYSLVEVKGESRELVTIVCKKHGEFNQRKDAHLKGSGCRHCVHESIIGKFKYTVDSFKEAIKQIHGDALNLDKTIFNGVKEKVIVTCPLHGDYKVFTHSLFAGHSCRECMKDRFRTSSSEFITRSKEKHGDFYDYSKVGDIVSTGQKVTIVCPLHGKFQQNYTAHISGKGCPTCGYTKSVSSRMMSTEDFIIRAKKVHGDLFDYSLVKFTGWEKYVKIICRTHGEFEQLAGSHLCGRGCRQCNNERTTYDMVDRYSRDTQLGERLGSIYILRMWDDSEEFIKVGITCNKKGRLKVYNKQRGIYDYEFIYEKELPNLKSAILERELFRHLKSLGLKYKPIKKFTGRSECFSLAGLEECVNFIENSNE